MPANVYFSASLLATRLSASDGSGQPVSVSDLGLGMDLSVGREWWVSDNWGLGAAVQFMAGRMHDRSFEDNGVSSSATWNALGLMLAFSATYN